MADERPSLGQALSEDRRAYERARADAEAAVPGLADLSGRLRLFFGAAGREGGRGALDHQAG